MTSRLFSGAAVGFDGHLIEIESDSSAGLPSVSIVGLGNKAVHEARERVRSAITNSGFTFPARRVTVNLAPADLPKSETHFDLPIALSILVVSGQLRPRDVAETLFAGELALDGTLRPVRGALHLSDLAAARGFRRLIVPAQNYTQAAMAGALDVVGLRTLQDVFRYLKGQTDGAAIQSEPLVSNAYDGPFLDDIVGQSQAKRVLAIAAAGHHNLLFSGPPGSGKTMLAHVLRGLLPPLNIDEIIATNKINNMVTKEIDAIISTRPFRAPHHSASRTSIIGGALPGEISLAHHGVLFLDELPEYHHDVLEALRQPLEDRRITIARASRSLSFPADFMLVATKNPCPCGYDGDPAHECRCSAGQLAAYASRISGPLLDRIDLSVHVARVPHDSLHVHQTDGHPQHDALTVRIAAARDAQAMRYGSGRTNATLPSPEVNRLITLPDDARALLQTAAKRLDLSARAYFKIVRVARSIADLDGAQSVTSAHIGEALHYRLPSHLG